MERMSLTHRAAAAFVLIAAAVLAGRTPPASAEDRGRSFELDLARLGLPEGSFAVAQSTAPPPPPPPPCLLPAAPSNLVAIAVSYNQVNLSWMDNSTDETGFILARNANGAGWVNLASVGANVTAYSDTTVQPSTSYEYSVRSTNACGHGGFANTASVTTPPLPPADSDGDGAPDSSDNCPGVANADQADHDGDGAGNVCDAFPHNKNRR